MTVSGTIGWFVLSSGESVLRVVLWRCIFGALTLFLACAAMGLLHHLRNKRVLLLGSLGGVTIVLNWLLLFSAYSRSSISIACGRFWASGWSSIASTRRLRPGSAESPAHSAAGSME